MPYDAEGNYRRRDDSIPLKAVHRIIDAYSYREDFLQIIEKYKKAGMIGKNYNFDNISVGNKNYPYCTNCKVRHVSGAEDEKCEICFPGILRHQPPIPDEQRCVFVYTTAPASFSPGKRCNRSRCEKSLYCNKHGGKLKRRRQSGSDKIYRNGRTITVGKFYDQVLGPTLTQVMTQIAEAPPEELYGVEDEIKLLVASTLPVIEGYNDLVEWDENHGKRFKSRLKSIDRQIEKTETEMEGVESPELQLQYVQHLNLLMNEKNTINEKLLTLERRKLNASQSVQKNMQNVIDAKQKATDIYLKHVQTISVDQIQLLVSQIIKIIYDNCRGDNHWLAENIEEEMRTTLRLPGVQEEQVRGANTEADEMIKAMVGSLPLLEAN